MNFVSVPNVEKMLEYWFQAPPPAPVSRVYPLPFRCEYLCIFIHIVYIIDKFTTLLKGKRLQIFLLTGKLRTKYLCK